MKKLQYLLIFAISLLLIASCQKSEPKSDPAPSTPEVTADTSNSEAKPEEQAKPENPPQAGVQPKTDETAPNHPQNQNDQPFRVDFKSKDFPEIHTTVTQKEQPWGVIERTTLHWAEDIEIYYEIPVFKGDNPAYEKINAAMNQIKSGFFTKENLESAWGYEYERHQDPDNGMLDEKFQNVYNLTDIQITDKYISFIMTYSWYMGGTNDYGYRPYAFDINGNALKLTDLYKKSDKDIKKMIIKAVKDYLDANQGSQDLLEGDILNQIETFNFYIKDDIPHVTFSKYEIAVGAAGAFDIPLPKP